MLVTPTAVAAALLAAAAAALLVPPSPVPRARRVLGHDRPRRQADPGLLVVAGLVVVGTLVAGFPWGTLVAAALAPVVRARLAGATRSGPVAVAAELPVALDLVAAALAAGQPPAVAVAAAARAVQGDVGTDLEALAARLAAVGDPQALWRDAPERHDLAPLARAVVRAERSGAAPAPVVSRAADDVRRRRQAERTRRTRSGGVATALPLGLCFLPAFFLVGIVPTVLGLATEVLP
jgi:Flp pilus assembly protein TadB